MIKHYKPVSSAYWYAICNDKLPQFKNLLNNRLDIHDVFWSDLLNELYEFLKKSSPRPNSRLYKKVRKCGNVRVYTALQNDINYFITDTLSHSENYLVLNDVKIQHGLHLITKKKSELQSATSQLILELKDSPKDITDIIVKYL